MNHLFDPENRFWSFMNKIMDVFFIGILWFVFSIPIVTAGAAFTALYQFTLKQTDDEEGYVWKSFWRAFVKNFRQSTLLWLAVLASGAFLAADLYACLHMDLPGVWRSMSFGILACLAVLWLLTALYLFPLISRYDRPMGLIVKDAFVMAVGNLTVSVTILVIYAAFLALSWLLPILFPIFIALGAFVSSYLFRYVFSRYWEDVR